MGAGLTGLTHLDLFGAQITDSGTKYLSCKLKQPFIFCKYCKKIQFFFVYVKVLNTEQERSYHFFTDG